MGPRQTILLTLARGRRLSHRVRLTYRDAAGDTTEREVDVLGLSFQDACWYAFVHCHLRRAVRMLRVDRLVRARGTRRRATARPPRGFEPAFFASVGYLDPGAPVTHLTSIRVEGGLRAAAPILFPTAILERQGPALLCHVRSSRPAVLAEIVHSLGDEATLLDEPSGTLRVTCPRLIRAPPSGAS